jgi:alpha-galactosidase
MIDFTSIPPFSFTYDGVRFAELAHTWARTDGRRRLGGQRTQYTHVWSNGHLEVSLVAIEYADYRTTEWTVTLTNVGATDTGLVADLLALDDAIPQAGAAPVQIHTTNGSYCVAKDFAPRDYALEPGAYKLFFPMDGRATDGFHRDADLTAAVQGGGWPYFNIDWGDHGLILAVGWPGQWVCQMTRDATGLMTRDATGLRLQAGMSSQPASGYVPTSSIADALLVRTILRPGESIRTPLIVCQSWRSQTWQVAQNAWRRWMLAHNTPRLPDEPPGPMSPTGAVCGYFPGLLDTATDEVAFLSGPDGFVAHGTVAGPHGTTLQGDIYEYWWMDAGWYPVPAGKTWSAVGTWTTDPERYPQGIKPIADLAHAHNLKLILWYEPERVTPGTELARDHQDYLLGDPAGTQLFNFGDSNALAWALERFDRLIESQGVDIFRHDFNMNPLSYWNGNDTPDRRGMAQIAYVHGLLAYWDALRRRHPGMLIDLCASGGRRLDLESLRRGVPFLRSDYQFEPVGQQSRTYGISFWLPFNGGGITPVTPQTGHTGPPRMSCAVASCLASALASTFAQPRKRTGRRSKR